MDAEIAGMPFAGLEIPIISSFGAEMNLRDYFAGQAIIGLCAASAEPAFGLAMQRKIADTAFDIADAMLVRRSH